MGEPKGVSTKPNAILVGPIDQTLSSVRTEEMALAWIDARDFASGSVAPQQLQLFELKAEREAGLMSRLSQFERTVSEAWRALRSNGHLLVVTPVSCSHRVRLVLDDVCGGKQFRDEVVVASQASPSSRRSAASEERSVIIAYAKSASSPLLRLGSHDVNSADDRVYRLVDHDTGRRYTLAACVHPYPRGPEFVYEWNGIKRVWRWRKDELDALYAAGNIVLTRSGIPRLKRYLDEVTTKRRRQRATAFSSTEAAHAHDARLGAFAQRIIRVSTEDADLVITIPGSAEIVCAAQRLGRRWMSVSESYKQSALIRNALRAVFGFSISERYSWNGKQTLQELVELSRRDPEEFKYWVLTALTASPTDGLRSSDHGIDGRIFFGGMRRPAPVIVKCSPLTTQHMREVEAIKRRMNADVAVLVGTDTAGARHNRINIPGVEVVLLRGLTSDPRAGLDIALEHRARRLAMKTPAPEQRPLAARARR